MAAKSKKQVVDAKFFLVLVDESEGLHQALYYACIRAKSAGLRVALLYVIAPAEFAHWAGVGALMREEARDMAEEKMRVHADYVQDLTGQPPIMYIREGKVVEEVISLMNEEDSIISLVLGAETESDSAGPVTTYRVGCEMGQGRALVVIVLGNLSDEQIEVLV